MSAPLADADHPPFVAFDREQMPRASFAIAIAATGSSLDRRPRRTARISADLWRRAPRWRWPPKAIFTGHGMTVGPPACWLAPISLSLFEILNALQEALDDFGNLALAHGSMSYHVCDDVSSRPRA